MKFRIGRDLNSDWVIEDSTVSSIHACVVIEQGEFTIIDLGSTNGTFVNDLPIVKKHFSFGDRIRLGDYQIESEELNKRIKDFTIQNKTDFTEEYDKLKEIYKEYNKKKNKVEQGTKNKQLLLRLLIMLALFAIAYLVTDGVTSFIVISILASVIANLLIKNKTGQEKKEDIYFEYADEIKCPKCETELIKQSWRYWKRKGECPNKNCDAKWN